jgi:hypothetical protein
MKTLIYASLIIAGVVAILAGPSLLRGRRFDPRPADLIAREAQTTNTVKAWLEAQRKGQEGFEYWQKDAYKPFALYAVTSYEIVDAFSPSQCIVRVHSSIRSGQPIVRLYAVTVFDGKIAAVTGQGDEDAIIGWPKAWRP